MRSIFIYGFALSFLIGFAACENDPAEVNSITKRDTFPVLTTQQVDMLGSDSARLKIHLTAPRSEEFIGEVQKTVFPQGVFIEFYDDSGLVSSSMQSQYAERRPKEKKTIAKQKVVVVNTKGDKLETEKLILDEGINRIYTDAFVKITTADQVLWGTGLDADAAFTEYEIKNIEGTLLLGE